MINFLNELGNFKQKNFYTSKWKIFLHFKTTDPIWNEHSRYLICWHVHNSFHISGSLLVVIWRKAVWWLGHNFFRYILHVINNVKWIRTSICSNFIFFFYDVRVLALRLSFILQMWVSICLWNKLHSKPNNMELPSHIPCLHTYPCVKLFLESWYSFPYVLLM